MQARFSEGVEKVKGRCRCREGVGKVIFGAFQSTSKGPVGQTRVAANLCMDLSNKVHPATSRH